MRSRVIPASPEFLWRRPLKYAIVTGILDAPARLGRKGRAMKHYVLLKLAPGADGDALAGSMRETYRKLEEAMESLHSPRVCRNCVARDSNYDILAEIELDRPEDLQAYLTHPLHVAMAEGFKGVVAGRVSFDCE